MYGAKAIETLISTWEEIKTTYEQNQEDIKNTEYELQDLMHAIEFGKLNASQRIKIFNEFREARQRRRRLKNQNEALEPLYRIIAHKSFENHKVDLYKAKTEIYKIVDAQLKRSYLPRVRQDLNSMVQEHVGE